MSKDIENLSSEELSLSGIAAWCKSIKYKTTAANVLQEVESMLLASGLVGYFPTISELSSGGYKVLFKKK